MTPGLRAFVVHWDAREVEEKVAFAKTCGLAVVGHEAEDGSRAMRAVKDLEPGILLIWLSRLPSHGRVTAHAIRSAAWGRRLPIVFVEGDPDFLGDTKMAKVRRDIPDAFVATPARLSEAVAQAMVWAREAQAERLASKSR